MQSSTLGLGVKDLLCPNSDPCRRMLVCDGLGFSTPYHLRAVNHYSCRFMSRRCTLQWGGLLSRELISVVAEGDFLHQWICWQQKLMGMLLK